MAHSFARNCIALALCTDAGCVSNSTGEYTCKNAATGEIDATANLYHDEEQTRKLIK